MIKYGIFAKTFVRPTLEETLGAVAAHGIDTIQFNLSCAGLPSMPERIDASLCDAIRRALSARQLTMAAVSGTFNLIDPDVPKRHQGLARLRVLARACAGMETSIITLCTGTRDRHNMWRHHPENDTPQAWGDLTASVSEAVAIAEEHDITLAFEPEVANVVDSARKARRLLDEFRSPHLKVVIDPANLFHRGELARMRAVLDDAFALLGTDIVIAHAKDVSRDGEAGHEAAGRGVLDYDYYLSLLHAAGFAGPLILHSLEEVDVDVCLDFLHRTVARSPYSAAMSVHGRAR